MSNEKLGAEQGRGVGETSDRELAIGCVCLWAIVSVAARYLFGAWAPAMIWAAIPAIVFWFGMLGRVSQEPK